MADHWVGAFRETPLRNHVQRSQFKLVSHQPFALPVRTGVRRVAFI
ncbi:hypothetical protein H6G89_26055 [Oscillatoria sp. FACHB-1407]|nr:hypothetical protein [Oscillatoria sp. FACHB-1407]MBD2464474.1 hypothetical protein [Oscillatoria sp. FACHB-1407]